MWDKKAYPAAPTGSTLPEKMRADCEAIMNCALKEKEVTEGGKVIKAFVVGKTRTYFKGGALEYLEAHRVTGLDAQAVAIQKAARGWLVRKDLCVSSNKKAEEAERLKREEEERQAELKRQADEREKKFQSELSGMDKEAKELQRKLEKEEAQGKVDIGVAEETAAKMEEEANALKERVKEEEAGVTTLKTEIARLQAKLDVNMKLIETLRKENKKAHKELDKMSEKHKSLHGNNSKLSKRCDSEAIAFETAEGEVSYQANINERLLDTLDNTKTENVHMKDGVQKGQAEYMATAEARLELQKTLAFILHTIQENCSDNKLLEECFSTAHACEAEAKLTMDALQAIHPN